MITKASIRRLKNWWRATWALVDHDEDFPIYPIVLRFVGLIIGLIYFFVVLISPALICAAPFVVVGVIVTSWLLIALINTVFFLIVSTKNAYDRWYENLEDGDDPDQR